MKEFRIKWAQSPTSRDQWRTFFVEANSAADAEKIAFDHVQRKYGFANFSMRVEEMTDKLPPGRVKEAL